MEDLNNLLNGGEVPNLFPPDERLQVSATGPGKLSGWAASHTALADLYHLLNRAEVPSLTLRLQAAPCAGPGEPPAWG